MKPVQHYEQGQLLLELDQFDQALESFDCAITAEPDNALSHYYRGRCLSRLGRLDEALASYDHAIELEPALADGYFRKSTIKLARGEFEEGWKLYEWRWKAQKQDGSFQCNRPLWLGNESIANKTIIILVEQGLGDVIQFCRYVPMVEALGAKVIFGLPAELVEIISGLKGNFEIITDDENVPEFDCYCPVMSLPLAFNTTLATIPRDIPYLVCDSGKAACWKSLLGTKARLRVGLVWSGGVRPDQPEVCAMNKRRNVPLSMFACFKHLDIEFYSLQKGQPAESELAELMTTAWDGPVILDYTSQLNDVSDTAALIENLDLVISVDTAVAHLAGALGKKVWILNRFDNCWRWLRDRSDSPWYPTATLYRQPAAGDWASVMAEVAGKLTELQLAFRRGCIAATP